MGEKLPVSYIADKAGQEDDVRNDAALLGTPNGPIIISIFTWDDQDQRWMPENRAEILIANLAQTNCGGVGAGPCQVMSVPGVSGRSSPAPARSRQAAGLARRAVPAP